MHVAFLIGDMQLGGAQRMTTNLIRVLSDAGINITLITLDIIDHHFTLPESVHIVAPRYKTPLKRNLPSAVRAMIFLRSSLKLTKADVYISFLFPSLFLLAGLGLKAKKIVSIRNNPKTLEFPDTVLLRRLLFRSAELILCQTKYARGIVHAQTAHPNVKVFPNFLDNRFVCGDTPPISDRPKNVIYVGRLVEGKGLHDLIWAFSDGLGRDWTLVLVGTGPIICKLKSYASTLNVQDRVVFVGTVEDVRPHLNSSKIFCLCSKSEGFPNSLMEAMSQGLCCVCYNCNAGPSDLIANGSNGFLLDVGDKKALSAKLKELSSNPELMEAVGASAKEIRNRYSQKVAGELFLKMIADGVGCTS